MQAYLRQVFPRWQNGNITTVMKSEEEAQRAIRISLEANFEAGALHFRVLIFSCSAPLALCSAVTWERTTHSILGWSCGRGRTACVCAQEADFVKFAHFGEQVQSKIWPQSNKNQKLSTEKWSHSWIYFVKIVQMRSLFWFHDKCSCLFIFKSCAFKRVLPSPTPYIPQLVETCSALRTGTRQPCSSYIMQNSVLVSYLARVPQEGCVGTAVLCSSPSWRWQCHSGLCFCLDPCWWGSNFPKERGHDHWLILCPQKVIFGLTSSWIGRMKWS